MKDKNIISYLGMEDGFSDGENGNIFVWDSWHKATAEEFYSQAEAFAVYLMEKGFWNQPIAIRSHHCLETLELYLGVLLSGNYYVPVDGNLAPQKEEKILQSVGVEKVYGSDILSEIKTAQSLSQREQLKQARRQLPEDAPLYLIYTSGSTGEPKGILKSHGNMVAFLDSYLEVFDFNSGDVLANQTPFCFDASAKDFYLMLKKRIPMYIVDAAMFLRPGELVHQLNQYKISIIQWVPSALSILSQLKSFEKEKPEYLRRVAFVGEVFSMRQLNYWRKKLPQTEFVNLYGASELAGVCCYYRVESGAEGEEVLQETLPLGRPLPHQRVYLIKDGRVVEEPEIQGEICIESEGIAGGYQGEEGVGRERFVSYLTEEIQGGRYYRTGDLGRYDRKGNLCFVGRMDHQIKHMGHRIELGEIEQTVMKLEQVEQAAAVYVKGKIKVYCQGEIGREELISYLRENLSDYMVPQKVEMIAKMPLNSHGKVDRRVLE